MVSIEKQALREVTDLNYDNHLRNSLNDFIIEIIIIVFYGS